MHKGILCLMRTDFFFVLFSQCSKILMGFDTLLELLTIQTLLIIYRKYCLHMCKLVIYLSFPSIMVTWQEIHCLAINIFNW